MTIVLIFPLSLLSSLRALSFVIWINRIRSQNQAVLKTNGRCDLSGGSEGGSPANTTAVQGAAARERSGLWSQKEIQVEF